MTTRLCRTRRGLVVLEGLCVVADSLAQVFACCSLGSGRYNVLQGREAKNYDKVWRFPFPCTIRSPNSVPIGSEPVAGFLVKDQARRSHAVRRQDNVGSSSKRGGSKACMRRRGV